jgi:phage-related protein
MASRGVERRGRAELEAQPLDIRARFLRIVQLIETVGLPSVREPYVKHLEGPLWEMRMKGKDGIARAVSVTASKQRVVIVRVFPKKTQKTPRREIELAHTRAMEVT